MRAPLRLAVTRQASHNGVSSRFKAKSLRQGARARLCGTRIMPSSAHCSVVLEHRSCNCCVCVCVCVCVCMCVCVTCSGAMSGGGKPRKGGMSSSVAAGAGYAAVSDEEVKLAELSVKEAFDVHAEAKQRRESLAMDVSAFAVFVC